MGGDSRSKDFHRHTEVEERSTGVIDIACTNSQGSAGTSRRKETGIYIRISCSDDHMDRGVGCSKFVDCIVKGGVSRSSQGHINHRSTFGVFSLLLDIIKTGNTRKWSAAQLDNNDIYIHVRGTPGTKRVF